MGDSRISWTDKVWNPVVGCTKVSPGCDHCYAEAIAERWRGGAGYPNGFDLTLKPKKLNDPLGWKQPARIFVNSMSDLFHKDIPDDYLKQVWNVMLAADWHSYQILTKRPHRMAHKIEELDLKVPDHIWLGVSAENQEMYDSRIPPLRRIDCSVRFVSCEPLLGPIQIYGELRDLAWIIVGGESGPKRRPMDKDWARYIRDRCLETDTAFWFKQGNDLYPDRDTELDGKEWRSFPDDKD